MITLCGLFSIESDISETVISPISSDNKSAAKNAELGSVNTIESISQAVNESLEEV